MRTPSAFRVPFWRFKCQTGEAPAEQVPVAATGITQTSWLPPTQAVMLLYVRRLPRPRPATAQAPASASLPGGWGLACGVRHGTRWALGRNSFPCSGRAKARCLAGCKLQADLSFQRLPHSLARGPSLHLQSQKQWPSLSREPRVWFSVARKAPCDEVESPPIVPFPGPAVGRSIHGAQGLGHRHLRGAGVSHYCNHHIARTKAQDKTNQGTSKTSSEQIRWLSRDRHVTLQNDLNSHTFHPEITNPK